MSVTTRYNQILKCVKFSYNLNGDVTRNSVKTRQTHSNRKFPSIFMIFVYLFDISSWNMKERKHEFDLHVRLQRVKTCMDTLQFVLAEL